MLAQLINKFSGFCKTGIFIIMFIKSCPLFPNLSPVTAVHNFIFFSFPLFCCRLHHSFQRASLIYIFWRKFCMKFWFLRACYMSCSSSFYLFYHHGLIFYLVSLLILQGSQCLLQRPAL